MKKQPTLPRGVIKAAFELAKLAEKLGSNVNIRDGVIDDGSLGIRWLAKELKEAHDNLEDLHGTKEAFITLIREVSSLRELSKYIHVGAIGPDEETIHWVISRVEKLCEQQMEFNDLQRQVTALADVTANRYGFENDKEPLAFLHDFIEKAHQKFHDKDVVAKELSEQINILGDFILAKYPDAIKSDGVCPTAVDIISKMQLELNLKSAALDDAMSQFNEAHKKVEDLTGVIEQVKPRLAILNPDHENFGQLLGLVMQYVANNRASLSERHVQMLKAITCLV